MRLEIHERVALLNILPKEGDDASLKAIRRAREMLSITPEELNYLELKTVTGADGKQMASWNKEKAADLVKEIPVDEYVSHTIRDLLADMNKRKKLTEEYISLYEKFVVTYQ